MQGAWLVQVVKKDPQVKQEEAHTMVVLDLHLTMGMMATTTHEGPHHHTRMVALLWVPQASGGQQRVDPIMMKAHTEVMVTRP
jgi:hypothetical protein